MLPVVQRMKTEICKICIEWIQSSLSVNSRRFIRDTVQTCFNKNINIISQIFLRLEYTLFYKQHFFLIYPQFHEMSLQYCLGVS